MARDALHALEVRLAAGLASDARGVQIPEAVARLLIEVDAERAVAMRELARRLDRDPSTVTRFVDRAVTEGLLERRAGARDRRQRMTFLTPRGRDVRHALLKARRKREAAWLSAVQDATGLGDGQVTWFLDALIRAANETGASTSASPRG